MNLMGDDTVELLSKEAASWNKTQSSIVPGKLDNPSMNQALQIQELSATEIDVNTLSSSQTHENKEETGPKPQINPRNNNSGRTRLITSLRRVSQDMTSFNSTNSTLPRKRPLEKGFGSETLDAPFKISPNYFPPLVLDSDLDLVLHEEQPPYYAESVASQPRSLETVSSVSSHDAVNGLNFRVQYPSDVLKHGKANSSLDQDKLNDLLAALDAKNREITQLKAELDEMRTAHQGELAYLAKELHTSYSKQASAKLRILYQRALSNARRDLEEFSNAEVTELRKLVELERIEKAELVKACDDYLSLNGF